MAFSIEGVRLGFVVEAPLQKGKRERVSFIWAVYEGRRGCGVCVYACNVCLWSCVYV